MINMDELKRIELEDAFILTFGSSDDIFKRVGIDKIPIGERARK